MIHSIWRLYVLYSILGYLLILGSIIITTYAIFLIILHHTTGPSCCQFFDICNTFFVCKTCKTATIHSFCLIILHTPPTMQSNVTSSRYTYTKVSSIHLYPYYCGLIHCINIIFRTIQGDFFIVLQWFVWYRSALKQYSYYRDIYCSWSASRLCDYAIVSYSPPPCQQVSEILWNITINVLLKSQVYYVTYFLNNAWQFFTKRYRNTLHSHYFIILSARFWTTGIFGRLAEFRCILHRTIIL